MNDIQRNSADGRIKILDIGCGDGAFMRNAIMAGIDAAFTGFDISPNMIRTAKNNLDRSRVDLFVADGFKMPLKPEAKFDLIHIDSVLHHLVGNTRDESIRLANSFCKQLIDRLSEKGSLVIEEVYYVSHMFPTITSFVIFYVLKLLNFLHLDVSKIVCELLPGLEVNFLYDKQIEKLLGPYGTVHLIKKTPWQAPRIYRFLLLKDLGHISYMLRLSPIPSKGYQR